MTRASGAVDLIFLLILASFLSVEEILPRDIRTAEGRPADSSDLAVARSITHHAGARKRKHTVLLSTTLTEMI